MKKTAQTEPASVEQAMVLVCEKCGLKLANSGEPNPSRVLQQSLKAACKERFQPGQYRPLVTSCLDLCPEGRIAGAILPTTDASHHTPVFFTLESPFAEDGVETILELIDRSRGLPK